jgi:hypothetical protein
MAPAHESETIVFNFRKLLSTLPNYAELEQILLFSVNWGKQVCVNVPMSSTTFRRILICVIFRPMDMQEYILMFSIALKWR